MELEKSVRDTQSMSARELNTQDRFLGWMYGHAIGRILLRPMVSPWFSKAGGWLLGQKISRIAIAPFVKANQIDLSMCEKKQFDSYNDFFTRRLVKEARPIDMEASAWISPCDGRLSVYPIEKTGRVTIKHTPYTVTQLLRDDDLARHFEGGTMWLYRLCVDDYHRYIYPDHGVKSRNVMVPGIFHTVNPVANDNYPIYKENTREYCLIKTEHFGTIAMIEVGAMLVGKIENKVWKRCGVRRGEEKGNFAFGGSTIIVLTQKGKTEPMELFLENTAKGIETKVKMGERVGTSKN